MKGREVSVDKEVTEKVTEMIMSIGDTMIMMIEMVEITEIMSMIGTKVTGMKERGDTAIVEKGLITNFSTGLQKVIDRLYDLLCINKLILFLKNFEIRKCCLKLRLCMAK